MCVCDVNSSEAGRYVVVTVKSKKTMVKILKIPTEDGCFKESLC